MSRIASRNKITKAYNYSNLQNALADIDTQVNLLSEGRVAAVNNASSVVPTVTATNTYAQGDFVRNSNVSVLGGAGSQYVILGWAYTGSTFVQCRALTGT